MSAGLSEDRLAEVAAMVEAATEGPWHTAAEAGDLGFGYPPDFVANWEGGYLRGVGTVNTGDGDEAEADLRLMLEAPTVFPELLAEIARQRKVILRLTGGADAGVQRVRLHKSEAGQWRVRWQQDGRPKAKTFPTEVEAQGWAEQLKAGAL